jgi:hypothetical protein
MHTQFDNIYKQIQQLGYIKKSIVGKLDQVKQIYGDMVKSNNNKKIFLLCLESFHFQYKAFNVELNNLDRLYLLLSNRAYNDYCSTYALLHKHYVEYGLQIPTESMHKPYKDLEPFAEYTLDEISLVHNNSVELLDGLKKKHKSNADSIISYKEKMMLGIRISSFIYTLEYDNNVLKDQIRLYDSYFQFYYEVQTRYFSGLLGKLKAFMGQIDGEIKIPDNSLIEENDTVSQVSDDAYIVQGYLEENQIELGNFVPLENQIELGNFVPLENQIELGNFVPLANAPSRELSVPLENQTDNNKIANNTETNIKNKTIDNVNNDVRETPFPDLALPLKEVNIIEDTINPISLTINEEPLELSKVVQIIQKKVDIETLSTDSGSEMIEQAIKVIDSTVSASDKPIRKRRGA